MADTTTDRLDHDVNALEMEMLNPPEKKGNATPKGPFDPGTPLHDLFLLIKQYISHGVELAKVYAELYPQRAKVILFVVAILLLRFSFFRHRHEVRYIPPHLVNHFGNVQSYYDLKVTKVDHWCLFGSDDTCDCNDPTDPTPRLEVGRWTEVFDLNKKRAKTKKNLDVVFVGDQFIEAMNGRYLQKRFRGGVEVEGHFNKSFHKSEGASVEGIALGIAGDEMAHVLWRMENGEIPDTLQPKVWWLLAGMNDVTRGHCSEEVVSLGILKLADMIASSRPNAIVVLQALLPRGDYEDGSVKVWKKPSNRDLEDTMTMAVLPTLRQGNAGGGGGKRAGLWGGRGNRTQAGGRFPKKEFYAASKYPLWPAIQAVNSELETFCENHDKVVFFDASDLFFGSLGNEYFQSTTKQLIHEMFGPDLATPSETGYKVLINVMEKEVARIVNGDYSNHKASASEKGNSY